MAEQFDYKGKKWKGRGYDTIVIAAPVNVKHVEGGLTEYMMAVIVTRESGRGTQRFYVHEAYAIKKDELLFKTGAAFQESRKSGNSSSSVYSILQKIVNDNGNDVTNSLKVDTEGRELTEAQQEFFKDAKTVDEKGRLKSFYHGTGRVERVGYTFRADRATSRPMAYFTDSKV